MPIADIAIEADARFFYAAAALINGAFARKSVAVDEQMTADIVIGPIHISVCGRFAPASVAGRGDAAEARGQNEHEGRQQQRQPDAMQDMMMSFVTAGASFEPFQLQGHQAMMTVLLEQAERPAAVLRA